MSFKYHEENNDIQEILDKKAKNKEIISAVLPFCGLALTIIILTISTNGLLLTPTNLVNIINQSFTTAIVGIGAAFVYAHGGIDFSMGASCGVAQLVCIYFVTQEGYPLIFGIMMALAVGVVCELIVGMGSYYLHLQPFVVSLCVRSACSGILIAGTNALGKNIRVPLEIFGIFNDNIVKSITLVILIVFTWYVFEKTSVGKTEKAIGGNLITAKQSGLAIGRNILFAYLILGICVGIAAVFQMSRSGMVTSTSGNGMEFNIMIALALGGFPMTGGSSARMRSMLVGVLTITFLTNGLILAGLAMEYVNIIKGLLFVIVVAASYDRTHIEQVAFV